MNIGMGLAAAGILALTTSTMASAAAGGDAVKPRAKSRTMPPLTEDQRERLKTAAEAAKKAAQDRMIAAERKRLRKAEKLQKLADKGAIERTAAVDIFAQFSSLAEAERGLKGQMSRTAIREGYKRSKENSSRS